MHKIIDSLKYIKFKDVFAPLYLMLALIPATILKIHFAIKKTPLWLVCENGDTARDNGYFFYKYMREKHPEINCKYVIRRQSRDYEKIAKLGLKPIQAFSLMHYITYLAAKWNISIYKSGNPNKVLFYIIHIWLKLINNRVYLKHGIIKDRLPYVYYKNTHFRYFVAGAEREYKFIDKEFGYPKEHIIFTGLPRYDTLIDESKNKKQILIMPTWRNWLGRDTNALHKDKNFKDTDYFKNWNSLINSQSFINWLKKNNTTAIFYPHQHMQKFLKYFKTPSKNIKVADLSTDIQEVLRESSLMITDYSSVYMDFAYMRKPVVYFQFDYDEYRDKQCPEGYFDYEKDGFGPIFQKPENILNAIKTVNLKKAKYEKRCDDFFRNNDSKNCERLFNILNGEGNRK